MQVGKSEVTGEQLKNTVRAYCFIENRWFTDEETSQLRDAVGKAWSGLFVDSVKIALGSKVRSSRYGAFLTVFALPFAAALSEYPQVSQDLASKYGYVIVVGGDGMVGIQLYFVERSAICLNDSLAHFANLSNLKQN